MIDKKYKWIYSYTLPCTRMGDEKIFWELLEQGKITRNLGGDFSRENVRRYFLTTHNLREILGAHKKDKFHKLAAYLHLSVPYQILQNDGDTLFCKLEDSLSRLPIGEEKVFGFKQLESARQRGVLKSDDEIIITHAGIIAESCKKKELAEYSEQLRSLQAA